MDADVLPVFMLSDEIVYSFSVCLSLLISGVWLMYVRKLDIFEVEKWKHIIITFVMGAAFSYIVPYEYRMLGNLGIRISGNPWNDFAYSVFAIGLLEESIKFLPVFIMLKFTKAIDEPYDYILYPSISALGFAFAENIYYLYNSGLFNIGGRALYSTVSHMVDSSIIGYGLLLMKYRLHTKNNIPGFLVFFFLAMLCHGFYDFWLINDYVTKLSFLTTVFFIGTIHLWFIFKNNAINISNYFDQARKLDNDDLKTYLLISLVSILILGYIIISLFYGLSPANRYLIQAWLSYGYMVLYLGFSFSRYTIIRGYFQKLRIPLNFFVPMPDKQSNSQNKGETK